jgi:hypothetical protein
MSLATRPMRTIRPRLVVMPDKVLVTDTLIGPISTDEVQVLRHVAHLASMVPDFDELQYAVRRAQHIKHADAILAKTEKSFFQPAVTPTKTA